MVMDEDNEIVHEESFTINRKTDNAELELLALIEALEYAEDGDVIYSDSDYCVKGALLRNSRELNPKVTI